MIRGALGSRYGISPLGRGVIRPASGGWWLSGGIAAANCIAAYQPKGAASLAASYVNLTGNASYNLTEISSSPAWDATDGWQFLESGGKYLNTNYVPTLRTCSMIVRFKDVNPDIATQGICGASNNLVNTTLALCGRWSMNQTAYGNGALAGKAGQTLSGIMAMAGKDFYINGSYVAACGDGSGSLTYSVTIGNINGYGDLYSTTADVLAFAIYDTVLTSTQVGLLTTAMAAL